MEITPNVITKPVFRDVALTLSPRETYLLALVLGGFPEFEKRKAVERFAAVSPRHGRTPEAVLRPLSCEDIQFLEGFYGKVMDMLQDVNGTL